MGQRMKQMLIQEGYRLVHTWSVRIVFLAFVAGGIFAGAAYECSGYIAPFAGYRSWGQTGVLLLIFVVAAQAAGEYRDGRIAEAVAAGAGRGQYFAAKVMGLFGVSAICYLTYTAVFCLLRSVLDGSDSGGYFSLYPLQVAVFLLCRLLLYWTYIAVFILMGVLARKRLWTLVLSFGVVFLEPFQMKAGWTAVGGPYIVMMQFEKYVGMADFLSYDFLLLMVPSLYVGVFALLLGYCVFGRSWKKAVRQKEEKDREQAALQKEEKDGEQAALQKEEKDGEQAALQKEEKDGEQAALQEEEERSGKALNMGKGDIGRTALGLAVMLALFLYPGQIKAHAAENSGEAGQAGAEMDNVGELRLVYGDESLDDEDAFVILLMADGFTAREQEKFFMGTRKIAGFLAGYSPFDEFADVTKVYALGTISAQSGIKGDRAKSSKAAEADSRDTFFGTFFWAGGVQRLMGSTEEGREKMYRLQMELLPEADLCCIVVNSDRHNGTGTINLQTPSYCIVTLEERVLPHELGHAIAWLADEYDSKDYYHAFETANMTQEADPRKVGWARYIGAGDVSVYEYQYEQKGWYHPSMTCRMRRDNMDKTEFCEVCKDALRERLSHRCNATKLFFQTYGDELTASGSGIDMRQYFTVRRKYTSLTGSEIPEELLQLEYYSEDGRRLETLPRKAGVYTIVARFLGNGALDPCTLTVSYRLRHSSAKVFWLSVAPLILGAAVWVIRLRSR